MRVIERLSAFKRDAKREAKGQHRAILIPSMPGYSGDSKRRMLIASTWRP